MFWQNQLCVCGWGQVGAAHSWQSRAVAIAVGVERHWSTQVFYSHLITQNWYSLLKRLESQGPFPSRAEPPQGWQQQRSEPGSCRGSGRKALAEQAAVQCPQLRTVIISFLPQWEMIRKGHWAANYINILLQFLQAAIEAAKGTECCTESREEGSSSWRKAKSSLAAQLTLRQGVLCIQRNLDKQWSKAL